MKTYKEKMNDEEIEITSFSNPMLHEDWHKAEELGLVYARYSHYGPDYWDDELIFCKPEDLAKVVAYNVEW